MKNVRIKSIFIAVVLCVVGSTQCIAQNEGGFYKFRILKMII